MAVRKSVDWLANVEKAFKKAVSHKLQLSTNAKSQVANLAQQISITIDNDVSSTSNINVVPNDTVCYRLIQNVLVIRLSSMYTCIHKLYTHTG